MAYELFSRKRTHGGPPAVSITKAGMFVINASAMEKYLHHQKFIHVYWDKDACKIGFKPLAKKEDKAYNIHFSPKGSVGALSATAFLKYIDYDVDETKSFPATWNEKEGLLEFQIPRGGRPKR